MAPYETCNMTATARQQETCLRFRIIKNCLEVFLLLTISIFPVGLIFGQNNFNPGEELKYIVYFGPINAGIADIKLTREYLNGRNHYHSKMVARSVGLPDMVYKVKDIYESYFDSITILPYMAIRDIKEGRYKKQNIDVYDHHNNVVFSSNKGDIPIHSSVQDVISSFYSLRNYDFYKLKKKDIITLDILFDDEIIRFNLHFMGKEEINTKMGTYNCLKFIPEMIDTKKNPPEGNISPTPNDDMTIWFSDDLNHVPIRVKFDLLIGSIKCDLIGFSGLKY